MLCKGFKVYNMNQYSQYFSFLQLFSSSEGLVSYVKLQVKIFLRHKSSFKTSADHITR